MGIQKLKLFEAKIGTSLCLYHCRISYIMHVYIALNELIF